MSQSLRYSDSTMTTITTELIFGLLGCLHLNFQARRALASKWSFLQKLVGSGTRWKTLSRIPGFSDVYDLEALRSW